MSHEHHGCITDGGTNIQPAEGDQVREAINRAEYVDHRAYGEVDGYAILVHARVTDSTLSGGFRPKLTVYVDGRYERDEDIYLSGSTVRESYETVWDLDEAFGELFRKHDLELVEGVGADE